MKDSIIIYIITFLIGALLSYLIKTIPKKIKKETTDINNIKVALRTILKNDLTNSGIVCLDIGYIWDFQLENWCDLMKSYEAFDGDGYIHTLDQKIKQLPVKKTDILQSKDNVL